MGTGLLGVNSTTLMEPVPSQAYDQPHDHCRMEGPGQKVMSQI